MIILELYLRLNANQNMEKVSKVNFQTNASKITNSSWQSKSRYTSENLLNEMRKIIYSVYPENKLLKRVYNNIVNSINV